MAKVLLHSLVFTPDGVSNAYLYRDLAVELQQKGHQVTVLTTTPHYNVIAEESLKQPLTKRWAGLFATSSIGAVQVIHIPMLKKSSKSIVRVFSALWFHVAAIITGVMVAGRQDIVFASSPPLSAGIIGALLARIWGACSVYIVQDVFPDGLIRQGKINSKFLISFLRKLEKFVYLSNDRVVVIAQSFVKTLKNRVNNSERLYLIENFVDTQLYTPIERYNEFSGKYGLDDFFVISYVGNIGNAQDFLPVLRAAQALHDLPVRFIIAGDGILRKKLEQQIQERKLINIITLGYVPRDLTPLVNASSDICLVLLSQHVKGDGFPSKIFSIMSCARTAIITADDGSDLKRVVQESGCGRVVPVGDVEAFVEAVRVAFNDRHALMAEGQHAREYVLRHYSKEAISSKYDKLIHELCLVSKKGSWEL